MTDTAKGAWAFLAFFALYLFLIAIGAYILDAGLDAAGNDTISYGEAYSITNVVPFMGFLFGLFQRPPKSTNTTTINNTVYKDEDFA